MNKFKNELEVLKKAIGHFHQTKLLITQFWGFKCRGIAHFLTVLGETYCKNTPNWHAPEHLLDSIVEFGMPVKWSGQRGESKLGDYKKWVDSINFHEMAR